MVASRERTTGVSSGACPAVSVTSRVKGATWSRWMSMKKKAGASEGPRGRLHHPDDLLRDLAPYAHLVLDEVCEFFRRVADRDRTLRGKLLAHVRQLDDARDFAA